MIRCRTAASQLRSYKPTVTKDASISPSYSLMLGVDEAGYGPNLGPLVIACSAWLVRLESDVQTDTEARLESLLETMHPHFQPKPLKQNGGYIPLGDSKAIYASGQGVDSLLPGLLFWLDQLGCVTRSRDHVVRFLAPELWQKVGTLAPWYTIEPTKSDNEDDRLPSLDSIVSEQVIFQSQRRIVEIGLSLVGLTARVVTEWEFNDGVERFGNKASLLSFESLNLARRAMDSAINVAKTQGKIIESVYVYCDKHGGRNRYQAPLMQVMPEIWFHPIREGTARSDYKASIDTDLPLHWSFLAKGDRLLGSALASMTAKWLRENFMARLNAYWRLLIPGLESTAGYPVDAVRFRQEIEPSAAQMEFPLSLWWRSR